MCGRHATVRSFWWAARVSTPRAASAAETRTVRSAVAVSGSTPKAASAAAADAWIASAPPSARGRRGADRGQEQGHDTGVGQCHVDQGLDGPQVPLGADRQAVHDLEHLLPDPGGPGQHGGVQRVLGGEVVLQAGLRQADRVRDLLHRGPGATPGQEGGGPVEDLVLGLLPVSAHASEARPHRPFGRWTGQIGR